MMGKCSKRLLTFLFAMFMSLSLLLVGFSRVANAAINKENFIQMNASDTSTQQISLISEAKPGTVSIESDIGEFAEFTLKVHPDLITVTLDIELFGVITPATSFTGYINFHDVNGNKIRSEYLSATLFYSKTFTMKYDMTSVEEYVSLGSGTLVKDFKSYSVGFMSVTRTYQKGGSYSSITNAMGGERHHMFASEVYSSTTVNRYDIYGNVTGTVSSSAGPCILMTPEDHMDTASWGSSTSAINYRNQQLALVKQGKYLEAMQMDIDDIRSKFPGKYEKAIQQALNYAKTTLLWYQ